MDEAETELCRTCRFYRDGTCRKRPPMAKGRDEMGFWPKVKDHDGCGEHEQKSVREQLPPNMTELTAKYLAVVHRLGIERYGGARGWKRRVAEDLGIHTTDLSRILRGPRRVGWELVVRACQVKGV